LSEAVQLSFWQEGHPVNEGVRAAAPVREKHPEKNNGSTQDASLTEGQRVVLQNGSFVRNRARTADASVSRTAREIKIGRMMQELSRKFGDSAVIRGSELTQGDGGRKTENDQKRKKDEHTDL
jgi:hypothetical protein